LRGRKIEKGNLRGYGSFFDPGFVGVFERDLEGVWDVKF
jgi:hypothetical protein